jgi:hypothetical protein
MIRGTGRRHAVTDLGSSPAADYHFETDHADDSVLRAIALVLGGLVVIGVVLVAVSIAVAHLFG